MKRTGRIRGCCRDQRGFTLSELMTSIVTFSLVGAGITSVFIGTLSSFGYQNRMADAQMDLATAMALIQDDLRAAGYVADNMNQPIFQQLTTGTASDSIQFVGDVNSDNVSERVTYTLTNGSLMRTQETWNGVNDWNAATAQPLAANITNFTLTFNIADPCTAVISQQTATQVLASGNTTFITVALTGSWTYKGTSISRTLTSDVAERQGNVRPTCS